MAASGVTAAKAKVKGKTCDLAEFQNGSGGLSKGGGSMSWADELDVTEFGGAAADLPALPDVAEASSYGAPPQTAASRLSSGPGDSRSPNYHSGSRGGGGGDGYRGGPPLPGTPPFKAYITNLHNSAREADISDFFGALNVQGVLLLRHSDTGNPRGAFAEFPGREPLAKAIEMDGMEMLGRSVRIAVAEARPDRGVRSNRGFGGGGGFADRDYNQRDGGDRGYGGGGFGGSRFEGSSGGQWRTNGPGAQGSLAPAAAPVAAAPASESNLESPAQSTTPSAPMPSAPKSNPFGNAKPVDVTVRMAELEERDAKRKAEAAKADTESRQATVASGVGGNGVSSQRPSAAAPSHSLSPHKASPDTTSAAPAEQKEATSTAPTDKTPVIKAPTGKLAAALGVQKEATPPQPAPSAPPPGPPKMAWQKPPPPPPINLADPTAEDTAAEPAIPTIPAQDATAEKVTAPEAPPAPDQQPLQQDQQQGRGQQQQGRGGPPGEYGGRGRGRRGDGRGRGGGGGVFRGGNRGRDGVSSDWVPRGGRGGRGFGPGRGGRSFEGNGPPGRNFNDSRNAPGNVDAASTGDNEWSEQGGRRRQYGAVHGERYGGDQRAAQPNTAAAKAEPTPAAPLAKSQNVFDLLGDE